jgi:hypothetical protein
MNGVSKIYDSETAWNCVGRLERDGRVYSSADSWDCIGRVEADGKIYPAGGGVFDSRSDQTWECVGRVERDGRVYSSGGGIFDSSPEKIWDCIGRVESDGKVYDAKKNWSCVGRVEGGDLIAGGATLLLLGPNQRSKASSLTRQPRASTATQVHSQPASSALSGSSSSYSAARSPRFGQESPRVRVPRGS